MNIFSVRNRFYAKVNGRFSLRAFETALDAKMHMRSGSFAEQYCKGIFLAIFQDAVDLRQEYLSYYAEEIKLILENTVLQRWTLLPKVKILLLIIKSQLI